MIQLASRVLPSRVVDWLIASLLVLVALVDRAYLSSMRLVMPPGDPFNFISSAVQLGRLTYSSGEKRLPLYSFFILVGSWLSDPLLVAKIISVVASAATIGLLYVLGRQLGIHRIPLAVVLVIASFEPHLSIMGIRPLADSLFVMLFVLSCVVFVYARPARSSAIALGVVFGLMLLTRYEAYLIIPILSLAILVQWWGKWRLVGWLVGTTVVVMTPWMLIAIPVYQGPWWNPYFNEVRTSDGTWAARDAAQFWNQASGIIKETNWDTAWREPQANLEEVANGEDEFPAAISTFRNPIWWLSLSALIGVLWLLITRTWHFLPIILSFIVYSSILAWWGPTFRFSSPLLAMWLLMAAAGLTTMWVLVSRWPLVLRVLGTTALVIGISWIGVHAATDFTGQAFKRIKDDNGKGYTLVQVIRDLHHEEGEVAFGPKVLMAEAYLGRTNSERHPPHRATMLYEEYPEATPQEYARLLQDHSPQYLVERPQDELAEVVSLLHEEGRIMDTKEYYHRAVGAKTGDRTFVHTLSWE